MGWGNDIVNEMVKSYGFSRSEWGEWSWSTDTIAKSFQDDPFWTTLDYLVWAVPVAKWGTAAAQVARGAKGAGAVGAAYKAGELGFKQAVKMRHAGGPSKWFGGRFASPITDKIDDDYLKLASKFVGDLQPWEKRGIMAHYKRELAMGENYMARTSEELAQSWTKSARNLGQKDIEAQNAYLSAVAEHMRAGVKPKQTRRPIRGLFRDPDADALRGPGPGDMLGFDTYRRQWRFRREIHERAYALNYFDEKTYLKRLDSYDANIYREFVELEEAQAALMAGGRKAPGFVGAAGKSARFLRQKHKGGREGLDLILDPRVSVNELARAGQAIVKGEFAQGVLGSVISRNADDVARVAEDILAGNKYLQKLHGLDDDTVAQIGKIAQSKWDLWKKGVGTVSHLDEEIAAMMGWAKGDDLLRSAKIPGYLKRLPDDLKGRWIDPIAADDLMNTLSFMDKDDFFLSFYKKSLAWFRASKTAYNPATWVRNFFGGIYFHNLATGGRPNLVPVDGIRALVKQDEWFEIGLRSGMAGSTWTHQTREAFEEAFGATLKKTGKHASATELILGNKKWAKFINSTASNMEYGYRMTDEMWKLDAFIKNAKKYAARHGVSAKSDDAIGWAAREVNMYMPTFIQHGQFTDAVRKHIPFFSFTSEALRITKNALTYKPHLIFAWAHMADVMSHTFGAMSGIDGDALAAAKEGLPDYMNNKQLLMLPFPSATRDGKPMFLDLSYLIPMANMVEGTQADSSFFGEVLSLSANPFVSITAGGLTGTDPFSGRPVEPRFTERQLGIPVPQPDSKSFAGQAVSGRRLVGLVEHIATVALPPLVPPGYVGTNLLEYARGQRHPESGELLEEGFFRTLGANFAGMRAYGPTAETQIQNVRRQAQRMGERVSQAWDRWEFAAANGDTGAMQKELDRILALKNAEGHDDPLGYVQKGLRSHAPGAFSNLSTKQLEAVLKRVRTIGELSERDRRILGELMVRYQSRSTKLGSMFR